jgi:hypothetical protein
MRSQSAVQIQIRPAMKSHPKIGTAGELPFVMEQKHCIDFATDGMPVLLRRESAACFLSETV